MIYISIVKSVMLDHSRISLADKILAIIGFNPSIGYCKKHRIYYYDNAYDTNHIFLCPYCFEELMKKPKVMERIKSFMEVTN